MHCALYYDNIVLALSGLTYQGSGKGAMLLPRNIIYTNGTMHYSQKWDMS